MSSTLSFLPVSDSIVLETPVVLRQIARAHRALGELKGAAGTIGAARLQLMAVEMEVAIHSGIPERIAEGYENISESMYATVAAIEEHLHTGVMLEEELLPDEGGRPAGVVLERLRESLARYDTEAAVIFEEARRAGLFRGKEAAAERLKRSMERYNFEEALELLDRMIHGGDGNNGK